MAGGFAYDAGAPDPGRTRDRMDLWRRMAAEGDSERFGRRLAWDGLTERDAERLMGTWHFGDGPLPDWTVTLGSVLERYTSRRRSDESTGISFEEFLTPFVEEFWSRLGSRTTGLSLLAETATVQLKEWFLRRGVLGVAPVLLRELSIRKALRESPLDTLLLRSTGGESRRHYNAMMADLQGPGLMDFFLDYPVMTRLLCEWTARLAEVIAEFLSRLERDYSELETLFGLSGRPKVKSLNAGLSDPHDHGRCVMLTLFEDNRAIIYKPKGAGQWEAWDGVLAWMNGRGAPLPFYRINFLRKDPHVWMEYLTPAPCRTQAEVRSYYRRLGNLLAVLHVLRGADIHTDNIIAHGEHPVLVDVEMLLQGRHRHRRTALVLKAIHDRACETFCGSVLATGLLPQWLDNGSGEEYDAGGAGGAEPYWRRLVFKNAGTDEMTLEFEKVPAGQHNTAQFEEKEIGLLDGRDDLLAGLDEMGRWLIRQKNALMGSEGPFERLAEHPVRFLLRNTESYVAVQNMAMDADSLRDGIDFSLRLESMAARWTQEEHGGDIWPLFWKELESMERMDIPLFTVLPGRRTVPGMDGKEIPVFELSGLERALALIEKLDERELAFQSDMACKAINSHADMLAVDMNWREPPPLRTGDPVDMSAFTRNAVERSGNIAGNIRDKRTLIDGASWWMEPAYDESMRRMKLGIMNLSLYNGTPGVALFLAAYDSVTGDRSFRPLVYEILEVVRPFLGKKTTAQSLARELGVGGIMGTGGLIYALARCGELLGDGALIDHASILASMLDADLIGRDRKLDIITGSAGAVLALLALHRIDTDNEALAAARLCGDHLLKRREPWREELHVWVDAIYTAPITGFSHGAAGIAYALWKLYLATGDERFAGAARDGVAFEDRLFDPGADNWRKSPDDDLNRKWGFWNTWCHGAPGIGLGRLGMLDMNAEAGRDAQRAVEALSKTPEHFCDHLCCGNFGRLEVFLTAGEKLGRDDLVAAARSGAAQILAERRGIDFRFNPHLSPGPISPALFVGTAGIGYELLRLAQPEKLPSLLVMD